jgi:hypothetical protein
LASSGLLTKSFWALACVCAFWCVCVCVCGSVSCVNMGGACACVCVCVCVRQVLGLLTEPKVKPNLCLFFVVAN